MPASDDSYDAVVLVGAGPAGAAAARLLASWGRRVVVLHHRTASPPLAESIPPSCRKLFDVLGVLDRVDGGGFLRLTGNTVCWAGAAPRVELFADEPGYQVERAAFDGLMRDLAREAGAELREAAARDVRAIDAPARVATASGDEVRAQFVLDCSGRAGVAARRGFRVASAAHPRTIALVGRWTGAAGWAEVEPTHTIVESYEDGWGWSVPVASGVRYVTAMVDPQRTHRARGQPALDVYLAELRKTVHLARLTEHAALDGGPWGCDASTYIANRYASERLLLVGDAGSFIDPLSSFGIKKALASAWLAAVAVNTALRTPEMRDAALAFFSDREAAAADALSEQSRLFFDRAAERHTSPFWVDRAAGADGPSPADVDVRTLREDPRVRRAFERVKAAPEIRLTRGAALRLAPRALVRGLEIVMEDRMFVDEFPQGVRYLRDVDLVGLLALAPQCRQVPELFDAYCRRFPPIALPDFLGALSVMLAFGMLEQDADRDDRAAAALVP